MEINNNIYSFKEMLDDLIKMVETSISQKPVELVTQIASNIPETLYGDSKKVRKIIDSLLKNAIKYTNKGDIIFKVDCIVEDNVCNIVISVIDTGMGIEAEKLNQVFDNNENTSLVITKEMIKVLGGKIIAQSIYGEGSKFTVHFEQKINNKIDTMEVQPMDENFLRENGVNLDNSLELLGDMGMYNETLDVFIEENNDRIPRLMNAKNSGDMGTYSIDVHALKSDCKYLGFMHLAELAYDHELKSKEGNVEYINSHYDELMEEYNKVQEIIRKYKGE